MSSNIRRNVWKCGRFLALLLAAWLAGLYGISWSWVCIVAFFAYIALFDASVSKDVFLNPATPVENGILCDHTNWLTKIIERLWPHTQQKVEVFLRKKFQQSIRKHLPSTLQSFHFTDICLGGQVPNVLQAEVKSSCQNCVILDIEIRYSSHCSVGFAIGRFESAFKDIEVHGILRVVLTDLNDAWPFFGNMNISFITPPTLKFNLTRGTNLLNITAIQDIIQDSMEAQLTRLLVLPNILTIPVQEVHGSSSQYPLPEGVLRVQVISAKDLAVGQKEYIDPYCIVQVGATRFKTDVSQKTLQPSWNKAYEFVVHDTELQFLEIQCVDAADSITSGSLGICCSNISSVIQNCDSSTWIPLEKTSSGSICISAQWMTLSDNTDKHSKVPGATALLSLGIQSAKNLPRGLRSLSEPSSYVRLMIGGETQQTSVVNSTSNPCWGHKLYFLLQNGSQDLLCEVIDDATDTCLGKITIPLADVLNFRDVLSKEYRLNSFLSSTASLMISLQVKILVHKGQTISNASSSCNQRPRRTSSSSTKVTKTPKSASVGKSRDDDPESELSSANAKGAKPKILIPGKGPVADSIPSSSAGVASTDKALRTIKTFPTFSTPSKSSAGQLPTRSSDADNMSSSDQSDILDSDNWSQTDNNVVAGGSTYIIISRPDGSTVSEIVQNPKGDNLSTTGKDKLDDLDTELHGRVQVTLRFSAKQQKLMIVVHQCCNLQPIDKEGAVADPYIVLTLYNQRTRVDRKRTKPQKNTLNPVFDETFEFKLSPTMIANAMLELRVKNKRSLFHKNKADMGSALLNISALELNEARTEWFLIQRSRRESIESLANDSLLKPKHNVSQAAH